MSNTKEVTFAGQKLYNTSYPYLSFVEIINCSAFNNSANEHSYIDASESKIRLANAYGNNHTISNNTNYDTGVIGLIY